MAPSRRAEDVMKARSMELVEYGYREPQHVSEPSTSRVGISHIFVALFIFSTVALPDGHPLVLTSRVLIVLYFFLGAISGKATVFNSFLFTSGFFFLLSSASLFWSVFPEISAARVYNICYNYVSLFALVNLISWKPERLEFCITWIVISALAGCAYAFFIQGATFQDTRQFEGVTASGQLALACAAGIAISISRLSSAQKGKYLLAIVLLFAALFFTSGRRGLIIATSFILIFQFLKPRWSARHLSNTVGIGVGLIAVYIGIMNIPILYEYIGYRLDSFLKYVMSGEISDASISGRDRLIELGSGWFMQSPYIGHGIDSFRALFSVNHGSWDTNADNNYIELATDLGIIGIASYYIPLLAFLIGGLSSRELRQATDTRFALAFVTAMSLIDFSQVWIFSKLGILVMLLCYLLVRRRTNDQAVSNPKRNTRSMQHCIEGDLVLRG